MSLPTDWYPAVEKYFSRPFAEQGTRSLSNGSEIELAIADQVFTLTRENGKNRVLQRKASSPQLRFKIPAESAQELLEDPSENLGEIGVKMLKLIATSDANRKIHMKIEAGFLSMLTKGYFGILTAGGGPLASYLATQGLNGIGALKAAFKKRG